MTLEDAFVQLNQRCLNLLYRGGDYGQYYCNSCGSMASANYDDDGRVDLTLEAHSKNCPIGTLLDHIRELKLDD